MDCITSGYDQVSKMESSDLLSSFALHVFVPVFVGASVYRYTANEFVGALWGSSALLTTIMLRQLSAPPSQLDPSKGGEKNGQNPINPLNPPQSTEITAKLELLNKEILDLSETLLNQLWAEQLTQNEFRLRKDAAELQLNQLTRSVKAPNDVLKLAELKNRIAYIKTEYSSYDNETKRVFRQKLSKDYIKVEIDDNGNCAFLSIALAQDPELQKFARKLFLWIEEQWDMKGASNWENPQLEQELRNKVLKASNDAPQWRAKFEQKLTKFNLKKDRISWADMFNLTLIPGMVEAREKTRMYILNELQQDKEECSSNIWSNVIVNIKDAEKTRDPQLIEDAYTGFPLPFRAKIKEVIRINYPSTIAEQLPQERNNLLACHKRNVVRGLLSYIMSTFSAFDPNANNTPLRNLLIDVYKQASDTVSLLDESWPKGKPLDEKRIEGLISRLDHPIVEHFVNTICHQAATVVEGEKKTFLNALYAPVATLEEPLKPKKEDPEPPINRKKEFAKSYAEAFLRNGTEKEENATPMWGGEGGVGFGQGAHKMEEEAWTARTTFENIQNFPLAQPILYNGNKHYDLLLPRANTYWETL